MKKTLKSSLERLLSVSMVLILLIGAFAGCGDTTCGDKETTPSLNAGADPDDLSGDDKEENEDDPTRVFTIAPLEPLSKEKQAEVESAWDEKMDGKLSWRRRINVDHFTVTKHRYYGTYNDCIVIFETIIDAIGTINIDGGIEVGGQKIKSYYLENVWIYYNGEFYDIRIAYENKLLTDSDISAIVKYNDEYEEYVERNK